MANVFTKVVESTGLPQDPVQKELAGLLSAQGLDAENLTLDQLREVMMDYLNTVFLEIAEEQSKSA